MQTELLNEGKPPQNGIKINYSCLPEAGGEIVPLFCFSVHWLSGFCIKPNFTESLWFLKKNLFNSVPQVRSMMLPDMSFFLETSSLASAVICAPTVPSVLPWLLSPWAGRAEAQLSKGRTSFCTGLNLSTWSFGTGQSHSLPLLPTHRTSQTAVCSPWMVNWEKSHQILLFVTNCHLGGQAQHLRSEF